LVQLAEVYATIREAGGELWALSPQEKSTNAALQLRYELPFHILADEQLEVIHAWGLFNDRDPKGRAIPYPAVYLIGPDRLVLWAVVSETTRDRADSAEVVNQLLAAAHANGQP
jgi:peroxiredoxin